MQQPATAKTWKTPTPDEFALWSGFEGREELLGRGLVQRLKTVIADVPYQHHLNDAVMKAQLTRVDGNLFQEAVTEAGRRGGLRLILDVVLGGNKRILRVQAGNPETAFKELVTFARSVYEVAVPNQVDIAIGGVGYPKDTNLYQASRARSYLFFAPVPVLCDRVGS